MSNILLKLAKTNTGILSKVPSNLINNVTSKLNLSPANLSDIKVWLDASDSSTITESSGSVSEWRDKSGQGNHATQATGANQPTTGIMSQSGLNVIDFSVGDFMQFAYLVPEDDFTIFIVAKSEESATFDFILAQSNNSDVDWSLLKTPSSFYYSAFTGATIGAGTGLPKAPDPIILGLTNDRSGSTNTFELYKNNASIGTVNADYPVTTTTLLLGAKEIGSQNRLDGWIAEVIIYEKTLSNSERNQVYSYLSSKWFTGFAIPNKVPGLNLWLDAADSSTITQSSGSVSEWRDKSANGNNATQATGSLQPEIGINNINGINVISFDNTNLFGLDASKLPGGGSARTLFIVAIPDTRAARQVISYGPNGIGLRFTVLFGATQLSVDVSNHSWGNSSLSNSGGNLLTIYMPEGANSDEIQIYKNSSSISPTTLAGAPRVVNTILSDSYLAGNSAGTPVFNGDIGEIIIYDRQLADTEIEQVENYLKTKWGI